MQHDQHGPKVAGRTEDLPPAWKRRFDERVAKYAVKHGRYISAQPADEAVKLDAVE